MKPPKHLTHIEPLEDRIAPALILNPYTVTYQDANGDTAVVKISKPLFTNATTAGNILQFTTTVSKATLTFTDNNTPESLSNINLLARTDATGLNISVTVLPQVGVGNLEVDVGSINAANFNTPNQVSENIDLGSIYIQGNLGYITAGASNYFFTPSIQSLTVQSMTTPDASTVLGPIGSLSVKGNFNANLAVIGYQFGSISKLYIGGSLQADSAGDSRSGEITFTGTIGSATIGNIIGGSGDQTGALVGSNANPSRIGSLTVTGALGSSVPAIEGSSGQDTGIVYAQSGIGRVTVMGDVTGGSGNASGQIAGPLGNVNITGNLIGGSGSGSGTLFSEFASTSGNAINVGIGNVTIGGNIQGGTAGSTGSAGDSGLISATSAKTITIGGSLIGGTFQSSSQDADTSGVIMVNSVQNLIIVGGITGGSGPNSGLITNQAGTTAATHYGNVLISGDITGGSGASSGGIELNGGLTNLISNLSVGGSVIGGSASLSGYVDLSGTFFGIVNVPGSISNLHIGGNVTGASGTESGYIHANANISTLSVGGNVAGGTADNTGEIVANGTLGIALIKGNLAGSTISASTALYDAGYIEAKTISSLQINGTVTSGANSGTGGIADSGAIRATENIVSLAIGGAVTGTAADPVIISALQGTRLNKTDLAISSLTFQKNVSYLDVLAGYSPPSSSTTATAPLGTASNYTAQIGTVTFAGNLSATNVVAGVTGISNGTKYPPAGQFGTASDAAITGTGTSGVTGIYSSIAKIVIAGTATGDATTGDSFGFVAQEVSAVSVGTPAVNIDLNPGTNNDHLVAVNGSNLFVNEVPAP